MKTIAKMVFGSHVYGTNVETSDTDYKEVYIPSGKDILLQRGLKTIHTSTGDDASKNSADDVDIERFTVQKYLGLLTQGQTVALDMLFVPSEHLITTSPEWEEIRANKERFIHSGVLSFVGYCRTQANKYGIKGSRMGAIKKALGEFNRLSKYDDVIRIADCLPLIGLLENEHINMTVCMGPNGKMEPHLEICNRKFGMRTKIEYTVEVLQKIYDGYGHRAKLAESNEGIDWKALMHAVRIKNQAMELLKTGQITFPRPEKEFLLQIRKGELDYNVVAKDIEEGLDKLEKMGSTLPKKPDMIYAEELILKFHRSMFQ